MSGGVVYYLSYIAVSVSIRMILSKKRGANIATVTPLSQFSKNNKMG
jgi:hypothetical protein